MGFKIIDNYLEDSEFSSIKSIFYGSEGIPWYFSDYTTKRLDKEDPESFQFTHILYNRNSFNHSGERFIMPILSRIKAFSLYRIKLNLIPKRDNIHTNAFHIDQKELVDNEIKYSIGIFYLNSNDGFTLLEDGTKIESVENRMLFLSGDTSHTGTTSTNDRRCLINFNFLNSETKDLYL